MVLVSTARPSYVVANDPAVAASIIEPGIGSVQRNLFYLVIR